MFSGKAVRRSLPPPPNGRRPPAAWLTAVLLAALLAFTCPAPPVLAADPPAWTLSDPAGHRWGLTLFEQPDPAWPSGRRLRLTARSPGLRLDHSRPLELHDGMGGQWELPNRSEELVVIGSNPLPPAAAQFDADALQPRPRQVLPLQLRIPLESSDGSEGAVIRLMLQPEVVAALHDLPVPTKDAAI